jgi:hypothetical protein
MCSMMVYDPGATSLFTITWIVVTFPAIVPMVLLYNQRPMSHIEVISK